MTSQYLMSLVVAVALALSMSLCLCLYGVYRQRAEFLSRFAIFYMGAKIVALVFIAYELGAVKGLSKVVCP